MIFKNLKNEIGSWLLSTGFTVLCFAILIFRWFHPYHRLIAIGLYVLSWVVYVIPLVLKKQKQKFIDNPEVKLLKKHYMSILIGLIFLALLYIFITLFPVNDIRTVELNISSETLDKDSLYARETINSLEKRTTLFINSSIFNLTFESSTPEKTKLLKDNYKIILDHYVILDKIIDKYQYFFYIDPYKDTSKHFGAFIIGYASYISKYNSANSLIKKIDENDYIESILNENIEPYGTNSYYDIKTKFFSPSSTIKIETGRSYMYLVNLTEIKNQLILFQKTNETLKELSIENLAVSDTALDSLEISVMESWLPIQKTIANVLGDTKTGTREEYFITDSQISEMKKEFEPGDIMYQRRNWYLSNVGMPGFWTHSALYIGSLTELDTYFKNESLDLYNMTVSEYLKIYNPEVYTVKLSTDIHGYEIVTIEGKSEGVVMLSIEESGKADYVAGVRPKISKKDKLLAVVFALDNYAKPYDYNFDFITDDTLVCSELIYKAYLPSTEKTGLTYEVELVAGRYLLAPNDMVQQFSESYGTVNEQNEFVFFYDGNEEKGIAEKKGVEEFLKSWERPRFDLLLD